MDEDAADLALVKFLHDRLDEDEQDAQRAASKADGHLWVVTGPDNAVGVDYDPARVLAEVAVKRRIIELHSGAHECSTFGRDGEVDNCTWCLGAFECSTLRLLAAVHADHEDYRREWAVPSSREPEGVATVGRPIGAGDVVVATMWDHDGKAHVLPVSQNRRGG